MAKKRQLPQVEIEKFNLIKNPLGYISNKEITNTDPRYLVTGSKNMLIKNGDKVVSRLGYKLDGQSNTVKSGVKSSSSFISKQGQRIVKAFDGESAGTGKLQVRTEYTAGTPLWYDLLSNLTYSNFSYTSWWYDDEVTRCMVFVDGTNNIRMWGGGIAYIKSNTSSTLTKTGAMKIGSTISFVAASKKILDSANTLVSSGFLPDDVIVVSGTTSNNGTYEILAVAPGEITLKSSYTLVNESAGVVMTIKEINTKTWAEEGFFVTHSGRSLTIPGYGDYVYTGGETTLTLTGLTGLPAITVGTPAFQKVVSVTSLVGVSPMINPNIIFNKDNHIFYGDTRTSVVWFSNITDYNDCSFTTPLRKSGEGGKIVLDNNMTGFMQDDTFIVIYAGYDDKYNITFKELNDVLADSLVNGITEKIEIDKKTSSGQASISNNSIFRVKNGYMYITRDNTLTWVTSIANVFTTQALPVSTFIKNDFDSFDLSTATGIYWDNSAWIAIPSENIVYVYDFDEELWQTPLTIPVSSFYIINNKLYGHSSTTNESYELNTGEDDNGVDIEFTTAWAYNQFGDRSVLKKFDEYYFEVYMPQSGNVEALFNYDYGGSQGTLSLELDGGDSSLMFMPSNDSSLGKEPLGKSPLGSSVSSVPSLVKYRVIWTMQTLDFFEFQPIFNCGTQIEIIAHGPNVTLSSSIPKSIKR